MSIFRGISFPFRIGPASLPAGAVDDDLIRGNLKQLVMTLRGERIMRPEVGTNIMSLIFENNNQVLADTLRAEIQTVVARYEPRVELRDVVASRTESEVLVLIDYVIIQTRTAASVSLSITSP